LCGKGASNAEDVEGAMMPLSSKRHFDSLCFSQNDRFEGCGKCPHRWWYKMLVCIQMGLLNSSAGPSRQIGQAVGKGEDELPHLSV